MPQCIARTEADPEGEGSSGNFLQTGGGGGPTTYSGQFVLDKFSPKRGGKGVRTACLPPPPPPPPYDDTGPNRPVAYKKTLDATKLQQG